MSGPIDDLTDKEKEVLRLLLTGHDAKSSATELDISVHTLNDRLRNARRKLGVSSSREAARILGDTEGRIPQNPAHAPFGIPPKDTAGDNADLTNTQPRKAFRFTWFAGGMLIMSLTIAAAVVGVFYFAGTAETTSATHPLDEAEQQAKVEDPESLDRAENFLRYVDAGDWKGSWDASGPFFRSQASAQEWTEIVEPVRKPLGKAGERRLASVQRASTLPGAPEGEYEVLQFHTEFAEMEGLAIETLVMLQGKDGWEVSGYFIRPANM